jgi:hypothetical protein
VAGVDRRGCCQLVEAVRLPERATHLNQVFGGLLAELLERLAELLLGIAKTDHLSTVEPTMLLLREQAVVRWQRTLLVKREIRTFMYGLSLMQSCGNEPRVPFPA